MRNTRYLSVFSILVVLAWLVAACAVPVAPAPAADTAAEAGSEPAAAESSEAASSDLLIGLVTDVGRVNDRSFNQSAWEGVQQAAEALGVDPETVKYIETQSATDYADNIQQFIDAGYSVIVTVGFALGDATIEAATNNPDVMFIGVDQFQGEALPNLAGLIFPKTNRASWPVCWPLA
ncbi:MAG: BMP family ABC transporter substrate-binding protein [Caldilineaceae bacterium]